MEPLKLEQKSYASSAERSPLKLGVVDAKLVIDTDLSKDLNYALSERFESNANQINCHLKGELVKLFASKGFDVSGVFSGVDTMTYAQKKAIERVFVPEIHITLAEKSIANYYKGRMTGTDGSIEFMASLNIMVIDPLTNEKLYYKSLDDMQEKFYISYKRVKARPVEPSKPEESDDNYDNEEDSYDPTRVAQEDKKERVIKGDEDIILMPTYDSVPNGLFIYASHLDKLFAATDNAILEAAQKYIKREELESLDSDIRELKALKRY